jgi:hypothetical protein
MNQAYKTWVDTMQLVQFSLLRARGILLYSTVVLLFLLTQIGHAETLKGQVLDAENGKPIAGAVVLGVWTKKSGLPGLHHTELVGVKEAETNEQGWFELEKPSGRFHEDGESVIVYKAGFVAWNNLFVFPGSARRKERTIPLRIPLDKFPQDQPHTKHVDFISGATRGHDNPDDTPKFWNAVRPEHLMH